MIIERINVYTMTSELPRPFAFSQQWVTRRSATLVEVITQDGQSGWGEALCAGLLEPELAASVLKHVITPRILGRSAFDSEVIWHELYNHTRDYGRKGVVIAAISALDIALWDLKGKATQRPVSDLLGGAFRPAHPRLCHRLLSYRARRRHPGPGGRSLPPPGGRLYQHENQAGLRRRQ